jgi:hypothetical protein
VFTRKINDSSLWERAVLNLTSEVRPSRSCLKQKKNLEFCLRIGFPLKFSYDVGWSNGMDILYSFESWGICMKIEKKKNMTLYLHFIGSKRSECINLSCMCKLVHHVNTGSVKFMNLPRGCNLVEIGKNRHISGNVSRHIVQWGQRALTWNPFLMS